MERRAPLASLDDFSFISYYSPAAGKKGPGGGGEPFSSPLLKKNGHGANGGGGGRRHESLPENNDNFENLAKYNASRKLRPLIKVPRDRYLF